MVFDGKTFNDGNDFDGGEHYSKKILAHKAIRPKAATIDFVGLWPLLADLVAVIEKLQGIRCASGGNAPKTFYRGRCAMMITIRGTP